MARSPHGKWAGSPHFGLRDFLEDASTRPERLEEALAELNQAFEDLGMTVRARSIVLSPEGEAGGSSVEISLVVANEERPFQLRVGV